MKRFPLILFASIFLLLCSSIVPPAFAKDEWLSVRSKHFQLVGNASEKEIRQVAIKLEQFRYVYILSPLLREFKLNDSVPTTVIVFKTSESFRPFKPVYQGKPASVAGFFEAGDDVNYIALTAESFSRNPYETIFHEYVHLLVHNTIGKAPAWLNEGLAEYYSTFDVLDDRKVLLGKVIPQHLLLLRQGKLLRLADLFAVDQNSGYYNEREKQSIFYAQSWLLVHYLMLGAGSDSANRFSQLIKLIADGLPTEKAFSAAFQTGYTNIENELQAYARSRMLPEEVSTLSQKLAVPTEFQAEPITESQAQTYLGDLLLHTQRFAEADPILQRAVKLDGSLSMAHASLGMLRMRQKRFGEAMEHLQKAIAADPNNSVAHYQYALALSRTSMDENLMVSDYPYEIAETMRRELRKAIELRPDFLDAYHLLAFVNLVREEQIDESIKLLKHALDISPRRDDCAFVLAQFYMRKNDFATARQVLERLLHQNNDQQLRDSVERLLKSMKKQEELLALLKATETQTEDAAPPGNGEVSLESALRKLEAGEQHTRGVLRRIDCAPGGVMFLVETKGQTLKLHANKLERVRFISFTPEARGMITCGVRDPTNAVVVTYRPNKEADGKNDGQAIALEFVPENFELKSRP